MSVEEARELTDRMKSAFDEVHRLSALLPRDRSRRASTTVYFIQTGTYDDDPIKIGIADSVTARLSQLQTGSPWELRLLGVMPGGVAEERALHRRFAHLHLRGEWFEGAPELLAAIEEMTR